MEENLMEVSEYRLTAEPRLSIVVPPIRSGVYVVPLHTPLSTQQRRSEDNELVANDESLADLQPENSDEEDTERPIILSQEQQKVEFMAALGLVPPAVLEEIHRRQQVLRAEYGNWWDRLHSTDFCLVPKTDSGIINGLQLEQVPYSSEFVEDTSGMPAQQVAAGPDEGALVEQITYLTSWPQSTTENTVHMEVTTSPDDVLDQQRGDLIQSLKYMQQLAAMKQLPVDEHQLQVTLQQLASALNIPQ